MNRNIVIGMISSTAYLKQIAPIFKSKYLDSPEAKKMANWCIEYFEKYKKAPEGDIEQIYFEKLRNKQISKEEGEIIEEIILPSLNDEYISKKFNVDYLIDQTFAYFNTKILEDYQEQIKELTDAGELEEAEQVAATPAPLLRNGGDSTDLNNESILTKVENAFNTEYQSVVKYPGALGEFMNYQLIRGAFVAFLAPEKRGKTYWMLDMAIRASKQKAKVAFIQAGDMTEAAQLKRIAMYLAKKSTLSKYVGDVYLPVKDCIYNQLNTCDKEERECDFGVFDGEYTEKQIRKEIDFETLKEAYESTPDYTPCHNCKYYKSNKIGCTWLKKIHIDAPVTSSEALKLYKSFFIDKNRYFKLDTHPANMLTTKAIRGILENWEQQDGFVPDLLIIDYADILATEGDFRQSQNKIWMDLRAISQEKHCLVVTATQADGKSYKQDTLTLDNFSEDKRKFAHVTAFYGLNQDQTGREKQIGILRINELLLREGDFDPRGQVTVLQKLQVGRPFLSSYF